MVRRDVVLLFVHKHHYHMASNVVIDINQVCRIIKSIQGQVYLNLLLENNMMCFLHYNRRGSYFVLF